MTCTVKSVCDQMAAETDREILLCYYNKLVDNINTMGYTNYTEDDEACTRTLAAKISSQIQNELGAIKSNDMHHEMTNLITTVTDSDVVTRMKRARAIMWFILMCVFLLIVVYLWNFK